MNKILIVLLLKLILILQSVAQDGIEAKTVSRIDSLFEHTSGKTPGYMIGVIKNTNYLLEKGYGSANLEHQIPISSSSVFNIASLSKQFTAACVALLILEGKITMEDNIKIYFPDFPNYDHEIQIKHLIYMTSGINDYYYNPRANGSDWSTLNFFNIDTAIAASLGNEVLMYPPGTQWSYSNINYMLLTKVVEKVSGLPFSEFARQRIFSPLQMNSTFVNDDIFQVIPNRALGYNYRDEDNTSWMVDNGYLPRTGSGFLQIHRNASHYGGSGVYTSMNDLKKWVANFETKEFGGQEFYDLMHKTVKFEHDKDNDALGLVFGDYNGREIIWYEGGDWGFSSYMMRFPDSQLTIIVLSNLGSGNARSYANRIIDILIDDGVVNLLGN